jgi:cation diffusion facilitator CzcD-associated flavoprotein CzcO
MQSACTHLSNTLILATYAISAHNKPQYAYCLLAVFGSPFAVLSHKQASLADMKSVAIIGAGPAGLVAAKTFLHSYPKDSFAVSMFEHGNTVGGLWAVESTTQGMINPEMRTNLSQFTVCFSDLAWETLNLRPPPNIYPKAWEVSRYLEHYYWKFIPAGVVAFQTQVTAVERIQLGWRLTAVELESKIEKVKIFDYLIVASGFFSEPKSLNFELKDIDHQSPILHSSQFRSLRDLSITGQQPTTGKILVVGGSHSGAEVAAASKSFDIPSLPGMHRSGFEVSASSRSRTSLGIS